MEIAENWDIEIKNGSKWSGINFTALWKYRDLLMLLVRRDFVSVYKQTILGPIWFFVQPVFTTLIFTVIFGNIARIGTEGAPQFLFYLGGITLWTYFSECLVKTSSTFVANANVFGKVYFPRLIMPLSVLISNLIKLGIQMTLFLLVWCYYFFVAHRIQTQLHLIWFLPFLVILTASLGLGFGLLISSLTTKYRDLTFLVGFGVQLLMYASPIVYPLSIVSSKYRMLILANPLTSIIETFKYIFMSSGVLAPLQLLYSFGFSVVLLTIALFLFGKVEKSFMDTV